MSKSLSRITRLIAAALVASNLVVTGMPTYRINAYADARSVSSYETKSVNAARYGLTQNVKDGAILHAWCWSFNAIKENMADIAEAGFSSVQTSPANTCLSIYPTMKLMGNDPDHGTDGAWWFNYQATDWKIGNYQLGTREEFKEMCDEAEKYGVKIIVDVLPNHTTPTLGEVTNDLKNAAGGQDALYHANGFNPISGPGWNDRYQCTTGQMNGLPDVNTENPGFQKYFLRYLNDCIECGADGFRYDTAKHIGLPDDPLDAKSTKNNFWPVVTGRESVDGVKLENADKIFNYGEVLQDTNVREKAYSEYISETASKYGDALRDAIHDNDFSAGRVMDYHHPVSSDKLITWVESHDTYCNDGISAGFSDWQIKMAWAVIDARKNGTPLFYSRPDGSSVGNRWGNNVLGAKGSDAFKDPEVVAVNKFRNAMVGESEYLRNINDSKQILAIERGTRGEVIVNLGGSQSIDYATNLADGTYKDQVSGRDFTVSNGKISGQLDGGKIAVIYNNNTPVVTATPGTPGIKKYASNSLEVTLNCKNVTNAQYSIDGQSAVSFTDGQKVTIGADKQFGQQTTLKLTGKSSIDGATVSNDYTYEKVDNCVEKPGIYLKKPSGWGNNINVYIYDEKSSSIVQKPAEWPGKPMNVLANGDYFYELPKDWTYGHTQVIFNDGSHQTPGSGEPGLYYTLGTAMRYEDGNWVEVPIRPTELVSGDISTNLAAPQYTGTAITINTEEATGGSGNYTYEFAVNNQVIKSASSDKSAVWTPNSEGTYTIKVTTTDSDGNSSYKTMSYTINKKVIVSPILVSLIVDKNSPQFVGTTLSLSAAAAGGNGQLQYSFSVMKNGIEVYSRAYSVNSATTWTPNAEGKYVISVTAKDSDGSTKTASQEFVINNVPDKEVAVTGITTKVSGTKVIITADAISKSGNDLLYKFYVHEGANGWIALGDFTSSNMAVWSPSVSGPLIIWVEARDNNGNKDVKYVNYNMN